MTEFTPFESLIGGAMIGLAAVILMAANGRIAGVSGLTHKLLPPNAARDIPALAFILGLVIAIPVFTLITGAAPERAVSGSTITLIAGGLLVGFGSTLGNGCTSGHGVCGISRLSTRSIVATCTFMATAFATVFIARHVIGG